MMEASSSSKPNVQVRNFEYFESDLLELKPGLLKELEAEFQEKEGLIRHYRILSEIEETRRMELEKKLENPEVLYVIEYDPNPEFPSMDVGVVRRNESGIEAVGSDGDFNNPFPTLLESGTAASQMEAEIDPPIPTTGYVQIEDFCFEEEEDQSLEDGEADNDSSSSSSVPGQRALDSPNQHSPKSSKLVELIQRVAQAQPESESDGIGMRSSATEVPKKAPLSRIGNGLFLNRNIKRAMRSKEISETGGKGKVKVIVFNGRPVHVSGGNTNKMEVSNLNEASIEMDFEVADPTEPEEGHHRTPDTQDDLGYLLFCNCVCGFQSPASKSGTWGLELHMRRQLFGNVFQCPEGNCQGSFRKLEGLKHHCRTVHHIHLLNFNHGCFMCGGQFRTRPELEEHRKKDCPERWRLEKAMQVKSLE